METSRRRVSCPISRGDRLRRTTALFSGTTPSPGTRRRPANPAVMRPSSEPAVASGGSAGQDDETARSNAVRPKGAEIDDDGSDSQCFSRIVPANDSSDPPPENRTHPLPPTETAAAQDACLFVVLCPPDGGAWSKFTCLLAFVAAFVCDGVYLSLFLFDARVGMSDRVPAGMRTLEHMAAIRLCQYATEPFACAFINYYGFRHCLFFGSLLCVVWFTPLYVFKSTNIFKNNIILATVGGIGMGMIKTSFAVLLSMLFVVNRPKAHLTFQLGTIAGMMIVPPFTEFAIDRTGWESAMVLHLGQYNENTCFAEASRRAEFFTVFLFLFDRLRCDCTDAVLTCSMLAFWLLVVTPVPLKIDVIDEDPLATNKWSNQSTAMKPAILRNAQNLLEKSRFPTILTAIGFKEFSRLRMVTFSVNTYVLNCCVRKTVANARNIYWMYEESTDRKICVRNFENMFESRLIGSRPMYRDDVLFIGNVGMLAANLKLREYAEYLMAMTRIFTVDDLKEEKDGRCRLFPIAITRALKSMFQLDIWFNSNFIALAFSEVLIQVSSSIPFIFVKGPPGLKSTSEAVLTLIAGCASSLCGRSFGFLCHENASNAVPLYHVGMASMAIGLSLLLYASADGFAEALPYFAIFGILSGYYMSMQNVTMYTVFPLEKYNNACAYISIVRALSSYAWITIAITIQTDDSTSNGDVYVFAGLLMLAGGVSVALLQLTTAFQTSSIKFGQHRSSEVL